MKAPLGIFCSWGYFSFGSSDFLLIFTFPFLTRVETSPYLFNKIERRLLQHTYAAAGQLQQG